ncbi:MAG: FAD-binding oxidoreductase [Promethearchaeota archaeon]|nr:MAG: FAD-binding oxidoreductase [Candidatus Lokiarchaeota archaeon]
MSKIEKAFNEIKTIVGLDHITDKDFMKAAYSRNVDPAFPDRWADMIVRPQNTEEISEIVKIANRYKIHMVPRGGGADLVGGSVTEGGILLDLTRLNKIIKIHENDFYCEVECGITWGKLLSELFKRDLTTGIVGPGSGYSATIGGGLSNSTAGFGSTKYGLVTDNCLGVEVVLPNPKGSIITTGAAANKYAPPFCRYGVSPDFTGLFMGDVGTMGIKTKAFLRLYPNPPIKVLRNYILNKNDYEIVADLMLRVQNGVRDGIQDLYINPLVVVRLLASIAEKKPKKRAKLTGPVFMFILEAFDERIMEVYKEKIDNIMLKNDRARFFEWTDIDENEVSSEEWTFKLKFPYSYFNKFVALAPPKISCTTCHKLPISKIAEKRNFSSQFDVKHRDEFPDQSFSLFARSIHLLPNGHCVVAGGFNAENVDSQRDIAMDIWHKKIRAQVRYGGVHYWLGEAISQSLVEANAYTPEFIDFFKDMKRTVDPNFLLSPNKFHFYNFQDNLSKYIVKDAE